MKTMKPMGLISTPFISYHDIKVNDVDLLEDAWGISSEFCDVINLLHQVKAVPGKRLTKRLIQKIRKHD
jgi:hypothetical protein